MMINNLNNNIRELLTVNNAGEHPVFEIGTEKDTAELIKVRVASYEAINSTLINTENTLKQLKINLQLQQIKLKYSPAYDGFKTLKQKEEQALLETRTEQLEITDLEKQVSILKSMLKSTEYELKLLFQLFKVEEGLI